MFRKDALHVLIDFRNTLINLGIVKPPLGMDWILAEIELGKKLEEKYGAGTYK